jgi:uncharacterized membrane protein YdjX (TVP38/TMEM64 family)
MLAGLDQFRDRLGSVQVFASAQSRRRFLGHALIAVAVIAVVLVAIRRYVTVLADPSELRVAIRATGALAPAVLIVLQSLQVVVAPIPGQVLAAVAGYLFGPWWGTLYNLIGVTIGSTVAFWLARRFGRRYVERIVHREALAWLDGLDDDRARATLFLCFLVPGLPDDVLCFAGGLTTIPLSHLVVIAVVGRAPAFFLVNVLGELAGAGEYGVVVGLVGVFGALTLLAVLYRERLVDAFGGSVSR